MIYDIRILLLYNRYIYKYNISIPKYVYLKVADNHRGVFFLHYLYVLFCFFFLLYYTTIYKEIIKKKLYYIILSHCVAWKQNVKIDSRPADSFFQIRIYYYNVHHTTPHTYIILIFFVLTVYTVCLFIIYCIHTTENELR